MSQQVLINPNTIFDINGYPIPLGSVTFFLTETTTPVIVYLDDDLSVVASQPVLADAAGRIPQLFCSNNQILKAVVKNEAGSTLYTLDPVVLSPVSATSASAITFTPMPNNPATTVQQAIANVQTELDELDATDIAYVNSDFPSVTNVDAALDITILKTGKTITTEDLNTLTVSGLYLQQNPTLVSLVRNYPYAANVNKGYFTIDVQVFANGGIKQVASDGYETYIRSFGLDPAVSIGTSVWTAWAQLVDTGPQGPWSYAWHPYNKLTLTDSANGVFYDSTANGVVATVTSPTFEPGFEYMISGAGVSPSATATLRYELYRETDDVYNPTVTLSASTGAAATIDFELELPSAQRSVQTHVSTFWSGANAGTNTSAAITKSSVQNNFAVAQRIENVRLSWSTGNIDLGVIKLLRRRITQ